MKRLKKTLSQYPNENNEHNNLTSFLHALTNNKVLFCNALLLFIYLHTVFPRLLIGIFACASYYIIVELGHVLL